MKCAKNIVLIFLITFMPSAWASLKNDGHFNISAGEKKITFQKNPNLEWRQFCFDIKLGCARFQHNNGNTAPTLGYIKIVTDQLPVKDFDNYCKEVFKISSKNDKSLNKFNIDKKSKMPHCSWMGESDVTHFYWKSGITIVVNTNDNFSVETILVEAKLKEKR